MDLLKSFSKNKLASKPANISQVGEKFVCTILASQNWTILQRNFRRKGFELDIVCMKGNSLVVVEVKTRKRPITTFNQLHTLLPQSKQKALKRGLEYLTGFYNLSRNLTLRIDLAVVEYTPSGRLKLVYFPAAI